MDIDALLKEHSALKARRAPLDRVYELIARYVLNRQSGFGSDLSLGEFFVHGDVYDDTAIRALNIMVSSLTGALWKGCKRTVRLKRPRKIRETQAVKEYYSEINQRLAYHMDHPKAGFDIAYQEFMTECGGYGTGAIGVFRTEGKKDNLVEYQTWPLKSLCIVEDASGNVVKVFCEFDFNAFQLRGAYGDVAANIDAVKAKLEARDYDTKFRVLWVIQPRNVYDVTVQNNLQMPYESIHVLKDPKAELKVSGFTEMPVKVSRFYKVRGEEYGRCPAMQALSSIVSANAIQEIIETNAEKRSNAAKYFLDDGTFGGGIVDRSPGSVTVIDVSSRVNSAAPFGDIDAGGDVNELYKVKETLVNQIMSHFFVDRLLDLNNQTRMTLGEAQIRNEMRSESLGALYNRQIQEGLTPTIVRTVSILFDEGELGVIEGSQKHRALVALGKEPLIIPPEIVEALSKGDDFYEIEYISPAARVLRSEELRGIMNTWQFAAAYSAVEPELMLKLKKERSLELINELGGGSEDILYSREEFEQEVANYREAQAEAAQQKLAAINADIAAKQGAAQQGSAQAQATLAGAGVGGGII